MTDTDTRDRVIRMEAEMDNLERQVGEMSAKVSEMHEILMQAKGARYVIVGAAACAGAVTGFLVKLFPFASSLPR